MENKGFFVFRCWMQHDEKMSVSRGLKTTDTLNQPEPISCHPRHHLKQIHPRPDTGPPHPAAAKLCPGCCVTRTMTVFFICLLLLLFLTLSAEWVGRPQTRGRLPPSRPSCPWLPQAWI